MHIVAIGGGPKTAAIKQGLEMAENSNVLLIPTACSTENGFNRKVNTIKGFFDKFGVPEVEILHDFNENPSKDRIEHLLGAAGFAYVIGGNTPHMMKRMAEHSTDKALISAGNTKLILAGTSAGAILPFEYGQSNPVTNPEEVVWDYEYIKGLGMVQATIGVHADSYDPINGSIRTETRFEHFQKTVREYSNKALSIENGAAVIIDDQGFEVISTREGAAVHVLEEESQDTFLTLYNGDKSTSIKNN